MGTKLEKATQGNDMNYLQPQLQTAFEAHKNNGSMMVSYLSNLAGDDREMLEMYWSLDGEGHQSILSYAEGVRKGQIVV